MNVGTEIGKGASIRRPVGHPHTLFVERYTAARKKEWDAFVDEAKNATFLFKRDYMEYHSDRFTDYSLMIFSGNRLVGLLPANLCAPGTIISHGGLTYGGLALSRSSTLEDVLEILYALACHLHGIGISRLLYKRIPGFYSTLPDDDILYGFFLIGARLYRRDCALVINQANRLPFSKCRKRWINKGRRLGVTVAQVPTFEPFWEQVLIPRLANRYHVQPTHTAEEITLLALRFPQHIKQFCAYYEGELVAGTTIYETSTVAHTQYIAVTDVGGKVGALDYLFRWLIEERYQNKRFFDFGICNERDGHFLNHGLLHWKQGFSARCFGHDFYEVRTENYPELAPALQNRI
jgi:hypothetical protein